MAVASGVGVSEKNVVTSVKHFAILASPAQKLLAMLRLGFTAYAVTDGSMSSVSPIQSVLR